jgi:hypothetical protein
VRTNRALKSQRRGRNRSIRGEQGRLDDPFKPEEALSQTQRQANTSRPPHPRRRHGQGGVVQELRTEQATDQLDHIVQSWDTAYEVPELSDFSVCTTWGIKDKDLYLLHVLRKRIEYPELNRAVREQREAFDAGVVPRALSRSRS